MYVHKVCKYQTQRHGWVLGLRMKLIMPVKSTESSFFEMLMYAVICIDMFM